MTEYTTLSKEQLIERLQAAVDPIIVIHTRPDGDAVGSAVALCHLFELMGKTATILCSDPMPRRLTFLWQGLRCTFAPDGRPHTVITVDVAAPEQLGTLPEILRGDLAPSMMIDHHDRSTVFADNYVVRRAAASGEIIWDLTCDMLRRGIITHTPKKLTDAIYAAISSDTGCFRYSNVTPHTMDCAKALMELGTDTAELNRLLFDCKTPKQLKAEAAVAERVELYEGGRIGGASVEYDEMNTDGYTPEDFETAIDIVRSVDGVEISVVAKGTSDGKSKCSLRSGGADVSALAAEFGGGGHVRAAGCTLDMCPTAALSTLVEAARRYLVG